MRLDKYLSHAGYGTRMQVQKIIKKGTVIVDGALCMNPGLEITSQVVQVEGQVATYEEFYYLMMNKPTGVLSASKDTRQPTVLDIIGDEIPVAVHVVGRLDKDSTGLLLLTNDGQLSHQLLSPKNKKPKVYLVTIDQPITTEEIKTLEAGIMLDEKKTLPCIILPTEECVYTVTLFEGRFHQIKRMFHHVKRNVLSLHRIQIASLYLDQTLPLGSYRPLTEQEIYELRSNFK